ncbi:hypothetical protein TCAL_02178 [Tigriopus californicus]|uniref:cellulose 1,4-beta-cellobiosidase (non-reducing end) n=1 Tax=Tigriopus californicus TaxID=6832 RepID=A0A553NVT3_TIGCA|nr:exoglucanase GH7B-like [Tigriopus californicus]TRY69537.1 hypothetical protein TCAL_02178 [Tigriopus californicus]
MKLFLIVSCLFSTICAQHAGTNIPEAAPQITIEKCSSGGSCQQEVSFITLDSNWRWIHHVDDSVNCFTVNEWDQQFCPDVSTCTSECALDGVDQANWSATFGIQTSGSELSLKFITEGPFFENEGSRVFLLESETKYKMFSLLNKEFTFDVDASQLDCGLNGALYFVEMEQDGGLSKYPTNEAGAKFGTGYCDAQCPHDMKWINGEANVQDWVPAENGEPGGNGHFGSCCMEMELWQANRKSQTYIAHACEVNEPTRCEGQDCGDDASGDRYNGVCDKDGCDFASYRMGDTSFFGEGSSFQVDSSKPVTVVTQFITDNGSDEGDLVEIRRKYVQNGQVIENSKVNFDGVSDYDSITDDFCTDIKDLFGDVNDHQKKGGLKAMGEALKRGMVLVMSMRDDHESYMLWLDSNYPEDGSGPGVERGP